MSKSSGLQKVVLVALVLGPVLLAAALFKTDERPDVDALNFEAMAAIVRDCSAAGRLVSDDYCKEIAWRLDLERHRQKERERLERVRARAMSMGTEGELPDF